MNETITKKFEASAVEAGGGGGAVQRLFDTEAKEDNEAMDEEDEVDGESLGSAETQIIEEIVDDNGELVEELYDVPTDEPVDEPVNRNWRGGSNKKGQVRRMNGDFYRTPKEYTRKGLEKIGLIREYIGDLVYEPFNGHGDISDVLEQEGNFRVMRSDKFTMETSTDFFTDFKPTVPGLIFTNTPWDKKAMYLKRLVDIGYPFCVLFPLASMGKKGFSKELNRCSTLSIIVLNKKYNFLTEMDESVDVDCCAWYCGNFPQGFFDSPLMFAFTDEDGDDEIDEDDCIAEEIVY